MSDRQKLNYTSIYVTFNTHLGTCMKPEKSRLKRNRKIDPIAHPAVSHFLEVLGTPYSFSKPPEKRSKKLTCYISLTWTTILKKLQTIDKWHEKNTIISKAILQYIRRIILQDTVLKYIVLINCNTKAFAQTSKQKLYCYTYSTCKNVINKKRTK